MLLHPYNMRFTEIIPRLVIRNGPHPMVNGAPILTTIAGMTVGKWLPTMIKKDIMSTPISLMTEMMFRRP